MLYSIPTLPLPYNVESINVLRQLNLATRRLAELKSLAHTIPNEEILFNTLVLQEAKDSSEVENIITTQDDLYRADLQIREVLPKAAEKVYFCE